MDKVKIEYLKNIIRKLALGDFNVPLDVPKDEDELTDIFVSLKLMLSEFKEIEKHREEDENLKIKMALAVEEDKMKLLKSQNEFLGEEVKKRTFELEKSFAKEKLDLEEISKLKDQFIFIAAHDLKAPVTVIRGYVNEIVDNKELVEKINAVDPFLLEALMGVNEAKDRLVALIADLLNVARMEAGKLTLDMKEVNALELTEKVAKSFTIFAREKGITLSFSRRNLEKNLIKTDPDRLIEVLSNLITNAVKYNKKDGRVDVAIGGDEKSLQIEISDTGVGLSEEEQKHLFEKFWRAGEVRGIEGTGLGLFIVKYIVNALGGEITVESEKGKGSRFIIKLSIVA